MIKKEEDKYNLVLEFKLNIRKAILPLKNIIYLKIRKILQKELEI